MRFRVRFSLVTDLSAVPIGLETTWDEFVSSIRAHVVTPDKSSVPLYSPSVFLPGAPKEVEYVESVSFGVVDLDHLNHAQATEFLTHCQTLPFRWAVHSTHSHGELSSDAKRNPVGVQEFAYRVLFPFLSPVPAKEWLEFWPRMVAMFVPPSGTYKVDQKCKSLNRSYYVPSTHPERQSLAMWYERADLPTFDPSSLRLAIRVENLGAKNPGALRALQAANPAASEDAPKKPVTRGALEALASRLKRKKVKTGEALAKVLDGLPWADDGDRDETLYRLAGDIAQEFPSADMREVGAFFALSVDRLRDIDQRAGNPVYSLDDIVAKLVRRQGEIQQETARKDLDREVERETRIRSAFREIGQERGEPYSEDELTLFAQLVGVSRPEFQRRWIIQSGGSFYFWFNGTYIGPIPESDASIAARKYLAPAPVDLDSKDAFGRVSPRSMPALVSEYATHSLHVTADLNSDTSVFDARHSTMIEAPCPLRPLDSRFWPEVDKWLQLMAGVKFDLLCDWLSWVTDLDRPCTALFLEGCPGAGKSLFAAGLARLWTNGPPTKLEQAIADKGGWTDSILRCPLVFADETVPKDNRGNARTEEIREFIQQRERPLKRRFKSDAVMRGSIRLVMAANNRNLLQSHETHLTPHDIQAIADRIVLIPVCEPSVRYLAALGYEGTKHWVTGNRIAEHVLWIVDNRIRNPAPPRFLVQSASSSGLHMDIAFGTSIGSAVAHWLVSFLEDPSRLWAGKHPSHSAFGITYSGKETGFLPGLLVSAQCVADNWDAYNTHVKAERATLRTVGLALQSISEGRVTWTFPDGTRRVCNRIPLVNLTAWGELNGFHQDSINAWVMRLEGLLNVRGLKR